MTTTANTTVPTASKPSKGRTIFITARGGSVARISYDSSNGKARKNTSTEFGHFSDRTDIQCIAMLVCTIEQSVAKELKFLEVYTLDSSAIKYFEYLKIKKAMKANEHLPQIEQSADFTTMFKDDYTEEEMQVISSFIDTMEANEIRVNMHKISELKKDNVDTTNLIQARLGQLANLAWNILPIPELVISEDLVDEEEDLA